MKVEKIFNHVACLAVLLVTLAAIGSDIFRTPFDTTITTTETLETK